MRTYVKLFKSGDSFAIETNADDENEFLAVISEELAELEFGGDWAFQYQGWLPIIVDICCKLRGYKSNVAERRVILGGYMDPPEEHLAKSKYLASESAHQG